MKETNIYIVDIARSDTAQISVLVEAESTTAARAHVAKSLITVRKAKHAELLGVDPDSVMRAVSGRPMPPQKELKEEIADRQGMVQ